MFLCHEAHPNADAIGPAILRPGVAEAGLTDAPPHLALIARAAFRGQASVDTPQATAPAVMNTHANPDIPNPDRGPEQRPPFNCRCPGASHVPGTAPAGRAICVACVADLPASTSTVAYQRPSRRGAIADGRRMCANFDWSAISSLCSEVDRSPVSQHL